MMSPQLSWQKDNMCANSDETPRRHTAGRAGDVGQVEQVSGHVPRCQVAVWSGGFWESIRKHTKRMISIGFAVEFDIRPNWWHAGKFEIHCSQMMILLVCVVSAYYRSWNEQDRCGTCFDMCNSRASVKRVRAEARIVYILYHLYQLVSGNTVN